jgi:hypothetical protein
MHRTWRCFGVAAVLASSVTFAQTTGVPISPPSGGSAVAQPDAISKMTSSVKNAYSEIDEAKGVLAGNSPTKSNSAASLLGKAEKELGTAKSAIPAGAQEKGTSLIDTAKEKVASARTELQSGHVDRAKKLLGEVPPLSSVEQSVKSGLSGATGIGGAGSEGTPPSGTPRSP